MSEDHTSREPHHRRQFGRRESSQPAYATLSGSAPVACTLRNISEGGALIDFGGVTVPTRNFKLTIDGVPFVMICEPRHQTGGSIGVRFLNQSDGAKLIARLFPGSEMTGKRGDADRAPRPASDPAALPTSRELRQKVLSSIAARAASEPSAEPQGLQQLPKQLWKNLTRAGLSTVASVSRPIKSVLNGVVPSQRMAGDEQELQSAACLEAPRLPEPIPPTTEATPLPDEAFRGYQPKRSRRNGIKGRSAGGIG